MAKAPSVTLVGVRAHVRPFGKVGVKVTLPEKPFRAVNVMVEVPPAPAVTITLVGEAEMVKSG